MGRIECVRYRHSNRPDTIKVDRVENTTDVRVGDEISEATLEWLRVFCGHEFEIRDSRRPRTRLFKIDLLGGGM